MDGLEAKLPSRSEDRPHVKVCGLTRSEDALLAAELGASFLGIILTQKSLRHVPMDRAKALIADIRATSNALIFGVFVSETAEEILKAKVELALDAVQIHGDVAKLDGLIPKEFTIPAVSIRDSEEAYRIEELGYHYPAILTDSFVAGQHGGTGKVFDHRLAQPLFTTHKVFLAGGLKPENIENVAYKLEGGPFPYALDLSSGLEAEPGIKSPDRMRLFFALWKRIRWSAL